jgi:hypothetical protein
LCKDSNGEGVFIEEEAGGKMENSPKRNEHSCGPWVSTCVVHRRALVYCREEGLELHISRTGKNQLSTKSQRALNLVPHERSCMVIR